MEVLMTNEEFLTEALSSENKKTSTILMILISAELETLFYSVYPSWSRPYGWLLFLYAILMLKNNALHHLKTDNSIIKVTKER